jgi:hypothetical protein
VGQPQLLAPEHRADFPDVHSAIRGQHDHDEVVGAGLHDHDLGRRTGLLWTRDHLIRPQQERQGNREAERLRGLEVDDEIELGRLFHGQVGLGALENLVHVGGGAPKQIGDVSVRRPSGPGIDKLLHGYTAGSRFFLRSATRRNMVREGHAVGLCAPWC